MGAVAFGCADDINADDDIGKVHQAFVGNGIGDAAIDHHPPMQPDRHEDGGNGR
ncbi:hypothetical protein D3C87_2139820 [compost metagenome]